MCHGSTPATPAASRWRRRAATTCPMQGRRGAMHDVRRHLRVGFYALAILTISVVVVACNEEISPANSSPGEETTSVDSTQPHTRSSSSDSSTIPNAGVESNSSSRVDIVEQEVAIPTVSAPGAASDDDMPVAAPDRCGIPGNDCDNQISAEETCGIPGNVCISLDSTDPTENVETPEIPVEVSDGSDAAGGSTPGGDGSAATSNSGGPSAAPSSR
jgi:hypothetical protein